MKKQLNELERQFESNEISMEQFHAEKKRLELEEAKEDFLAGKITADEFEQKGMSLKGLKKQPPVKKRQKLLRKQKKNRRI